MKRLFLFLFLLVAAGITPAFAESPEDQYVRIYGLIQDGDTAGKDNQPATAMAKYTEARSALERFQKVYPDWNPKVVNFRLNYLATKISDTAAATAPPPAPTPRPPETKPTVPTQPIPVAPKAPSEQERQLAQLQEDVRRLQADKSGLEAKLKEALSAQPTALDPAELAKAQKQISDLMKENELLKSSPEKTKTPTAAETKALEETRRALADANKKLTEEKERTDALAAERKALQGKLDTMAKTTVDSSQLDAIRKSLEEANHKLSTQTETTKKLSTEKEALQTQVKTLTANAATAEALRAENEILKKQLADAKTLAATKPDEETKRKLAEAETRIAALQSDAEILRLEKIALETRVKSLNSQTPTAPVASSVVSRPVSLPSDAARIKSLEEERNELVKKLDAANKELYGRKGKEVSAKIDSLNAQIATLRARVEVFEARAVPYTAEELALFKQTPAQLAAANPNANKKPISSLPGGTASLVASAQKHFAAKEFDQAEQDYLQILRRDENNAYTLANLAAIQLERGSLDDAEKSIKKALATSPEDAYSLSILGYVKFRQQKYDDALDALSRAATLNPQSAEIQNYLGVTLGHKGLRGPAETALRKAITIDPGYGAAHNNLAVIYASQQPPSLALAKWHYQKALAAGHPHNPELEKSLDQKTVTADAQ